jgi:urate oxidase
MGRGQQDADAWRHRFQLQMSHFGLVPSIIWYVLFAQGGQVMTTENVEARYDYIISYGKLQVPVYRTYASPLSGVAPVPESAFRGNPNILFAMEVDLEVFGNNFLPAYTRGDNSNVVATDSMKNFILRESLNYQGSTLEGLLDFLGSGFLKTYPQMESLRITGRQLPFAAVQVPQGTPGNFGDSEVLFSRLNDDYGFASLDMDRSSGSPTVTGHQCGRLGLKLFKVTGSAFTHFVRDEYTTLPERGDRPLYIYMDVYWKYANTAAMLSSDLASYVPSEQFRDVVQTVFHEFVSESIQHLMHEMGLRLLDRFPQLISVSFDGQNRTRDPVGLSEANPKVKVYTDPFPAYGHLKLTMSRKTEASGRK